MTDPSPLTFTSDWHLPSSTTDKLRLLLLYIIARDGISDEERRKLIQQARLAPDETDAFANLAFLGCHLKPSATSRSVPGVRPSYVGSSVRDKGSKKKGAADDEERPYDLSRFVPTLKYVMEDQCRNTLDLDLFPHTKELPPDDAGAPTVAKGLGISFGGRQVPVASADPDRGKVVSLRTTKPTWAKKTPELLAQMQAQAAETDPIKRAAQGEVDEDLRRNGGRVIVFVLGGMTYSELRSAYEVAKKERREIIVGGLARLAPVGLWTALNLIVSRNGLFPHAS